MVPEEPDNVCAHVHMWMCYVYAALLVLLPVVRIMHSCIHNSHAQCAMHNNIRFFLFFPLYHQDRQIQMEGNEPTIELLKLLSTEIARDGGASLVVLIKDYVNPNKIDKLVKQSIGCTKLLTFLEKHPAIFDAQRKSLPHFVKLLSDRYCNDCGLTRTVEQEKQALRDKVFYVLRKRAAQSSRRQLSGNSGEVNLCWLSKECTIRIHFFLRSTEFYRNIYPSCNDVRIVGSPEWHDMVQPEFEAFLRDRLRVENGKVKLPENDEEPDLQKFAQRLTELVDDDGGTQVNLSLLLHRNPDLKALLGGRDFIALANKHKDLFSKLIITPYGSDVELQSVKPYDGGRMAVDETGLFSVASSKWGTAMANAMAHACSHTALKLNAKEVTVIDMTASVGGHSLALAKTSFSKIIAIEIDPHRADLCRANMLKHQIGTKVEVRTADAVELIPQLAAELANCKRVVVVDPPWGGVHYKREKKPIFLGPWSLEDVVQKIAVHLSPTLVGLRLPVNFVVDEFKMLLQKRDLLFDIVNVRKLGPQLFVILALGAQRTADI